MFLFYFDLAITPDARVLDAINVSHALTIGQIIFPLALIAQCSISIVYLAVTFLEIIFVITNILPSDLPPENPLARFLSFAEVALIKSLRRCKQPFTLKAAVNQRASIAALELLAE
jgi:hypothetical protein